MFTDTAARLLLVAHAVLGAAAVGAATHLVIWLRKGRSVKRFAILALVLHALAFTCGALVYPTYRVDIRAAYFDNPKRQAADIIARDQALSAIAAREQTQAYEQSSPEELAVKTKSAVRWFDIKEHWTALGLLGSAALALAIAFWDRKRSSDLRPIVTGLALVVAGTVWLGAIVGVLTSAWRGV